MIEIRISLVSELSNTPVSTIRAYEKWGLISPAERLDNGYRVFEPYHVTQIKIVRLLFGGYLNKHLRTLSKQITSAAANRDWQLCKEKTAAYRNAIHNEKYRAIHAIEIIKSLSSQDVLRYEKTGETDTGTQYSAEQAATLVETTKGSIRNWERNGLINCQVKRYERRCYQATDIERMKIIDVMLQIGFSMSCIKRFFMLYDEGHVEEAIKSMELAPKKEDFLTSADGWVDMLTKHEARSMQIMELLEQEIL